MELKQRYVLWVSLVFCCKSLCDTFNDYPKKDQGHGTKIDQVLLWVRAPVYWFLRNLNTQKKECKYLWCKRIRYVWGRQHSKPSEDGNGGYSAMEMALTESELNPDDIDYVNAHGTSTQVGDLIELSAVEKLFSSNKRLFMSSNKSAIGHLLGAAGAVEAVFSFKSLITKTLPPTLNLDNPSVKTSINLIPHESVSEKVNNIISNSFGFGGTNASLIFGH